MADPPGPFRGIFGHTAIREQGGAYGGGASYNAGRGSFSFYSYRDPRVEGTLKDFGIADILQLIGQQQKTGALHLRAKEQEVDILFKDGNVVGATGTTRLVGPDAEGAAERVPGLDEIILTFDRGRRRGVEFLVRRRFIPLRRS